MFCFLHIIYKEKPISIEFYKPENRIFAAQKRSFTQNSIAKTRVYN